MGRRDLVDERVELQHHRVADQRAHRAHRRAVHPGVGRGPRGERLLGRSVARAVPDAELRVGPEARELPLEGARDAVGLVLGAVREDERRVGVGEDDRGCRARGAPRRGRRATSCSTGRRRSIANGTPERSWSARRTPISPTRVPRPSAATASSAPGRRGPSPAPRRRGRGRLRSGAASRRSARAARRGASSGWCSRDWRRRIVFPKRSATWRRDTFTFGITMSPPRPSAISPRSGRDGPRRRRRGSRGSSTPPAAPRPGDAAWSCLARPLRRSGWEAARPEPFGGAIIASQKHS